jgi:hypothetical protein
MGMPLRITFNNKDYSFQVVNTEPITKSTVEIPVIINGETFNLVKGLKGWSPKGETNELDIHLIQAIGQAIELRFRL